MPATAHRRSSIRDDSSLRKKRRTGRLPGAARWRWEGDNQRSLLVCFWVVLWYTISMTVHASSAPPVGVTDTTTSPRWTAGQVAASHLPTRTLVVRGATACRSRRRAVLAGLRG